MKNLKTNNILNNRLFEYFIIILILFNFLILILQTDSNINKVFNNYFILVEQFSMLIFTIEYIFRLIIIKNIKEIIKPLMLVDLLAIMPFYLSFLPTNFLILRIIRLLRLFKIFKFTRYTKAFDTIKDVFILKKNELIVSSCFFMAGLIIAASLMYLAERTAQKGFSSIPNSLWWAVMTFTSVGYGDICPKTPLGKIIASFTAIIGMALHGILIGVIGSGFMVAINKDKGQAK